MDRRGDAAATDSLSPAPLLSDVPEFRSLLDAVRKRYRELICTGLSGGASAFVIAELLRSVGRQTIWIVPESRRADRLVAELRCWWPDVRVAMFPAAELLPYNLVAEVDELGIKRLQVMGQMAAGEIDVLVVPAPALLNRVVPLPVIQDLQFTVETGMVMPPQVLVDRLVSLGYVHTTVVERPGEFTVRGGLVDVFPPTSAYPVRIEWFDDEIDSLRGFDIDSQRSVEQSQSLIICPAQELLLTPAARQRAIEGLQAELARIDAELQRAGDRARESQSRSSRLRERLVEHLDALQSQRSFPAIGWYLPYAYPDAPSVLGWLPDDAICIVEDWHRVREATTDRAAALQEQITDFLAAGYLCSGHARVYLEPTDIRSQLQSLQCLYLLSLPRRIEHVSPQALINFQSRGVPSFRGQWGLLADELHAWQQAHRRVTIAVSDRTKGERLKETLREHRLETVATADELQIPPPGNVVIATFPLPEGFELDNAGLVVLTEQELTGRPVRRRVRPAAGGGLRLRDYTELMEGDYVVHTHHGVGRYVGLRTMEIQGVRRDYLVLQYARGDRLYVPTDQIDLVQKYVGSEGREPKLSKLGGAEWGRIKERVKQSVRKMAEDLLALYAARETATGHAFAPDGPWQKEFEDAFPYEETEDQLRAIAEIKQDMESSRPMDRLLCGDVGFGKTEVAMRAAFKAVADGKQVAVLVPTTILAQQHYHTFTERFRPFPVTIKVLSRFQSVAEHADILTGLRRGTIDIVIGTHRLLQGDLAFKDLGLLIIDEEHRFGVAQKEQIKRLKHNVDVLSLTATPIPRTLHMALSDLRDMSVISTPPEDRYPVQTYVVEYSEAMIRDAIRRELARGGQVFYVHNRVQTIPIVAGKVGRLVPEAKVTFAHGQMEEAQLEKIMLDFLAGEYDVLVCTTIIESGLDISNVNTLIVEDADHLGLAQLYQLRGRVGRSNRVAYAYFTYRPDKTLTEVAEKRLEALKNFTDLGSGFKLALRDLEIRGAGNILGPEQHGFIASVGFELYSQLLAEAVRELRGDTATPRLQPTIDIRWDAYIPDDYISDGHLKVEFYRKIERARTREELAQIRDEMIDRFGPLPIPVWNLLLSAEFRLRAADCGVISITHQDNMIVLDLVALPMAQLQEAGLGDLRRGRRLELRNGRPRVIARLPKNDRNTLRRCLNGLLTDLAQVVGIGNNGDRMKSSSSVKN